MLGKQWLNRYASTDVRGTAIERSQNRQRKLDGIVAWYFDYVMESLPLMLQIALLLLGCALSRYLWEISITVASVVLAVTSFGLIFYLSIIIAGTVSESCPYQTPGARILRHVLPRILRTLHSAPSTISAFISSKFSRLMRASLICRFPVFWWSNLEWPWYTVKNAFVNLVFTFILTPPALLISLVVDACRLGFAMYRFLVVRSRMARHQFTGTSPQTLILDLQCISWMLQTNLDQEVNMSTLEHLESLMSTPAEFDSALVAYCFNAFVGCVSINDHQVAVTSGLERLATVSSVCLFRTVSYLSVIDPTSGVLKDISQRYAEIFPAEATFRGPEISHTMNVIRWVFIRSVDRQNFVWSNYKPPRDEFVIISQTLLQLAQFGFQRPRRAKVPRLILRFALFSLSLDPPPPTPVIVDCLSIIAVDLGIDLLNAEAATFDDRCVYAS